MRVEIGACEGQQLSRSGWYRLCTSGWLRTKECTRQAPTRGFVTQRSLYGMVPLRPATAVMCHRRYHAGLCWSSEYMLTSGLPWWCVGHMPVGFSVGFRDVRVCVGS